MNISKYYTTSPNTKKYIESTTHYLNAKYFHLLKRGKYDYANSSMFKLPKIKYNKYDDITLFDFGVYTYINSLTNRYYDYTNYIEMTNKKMLLQSIKMIFAKSNNHNLRIMPKVKETIDKLEKYRLLDFESNRVAIPLVQERYTYIPHIDVEHITNAMLKTNYKHMKYFEALGTYALMCSTNFSENTNRLNSSANGIVIAPRSVRAWTAAKINVIKSDIPSKRKLNKEEQDEYSNQVIDNALDWLEDNNLVATVHIYDYHPKFQDFRETTYYTSFRNIEGLYYFYETYANSEYNKYIKLDEVDAMNNYNGSVNVITEEYCQQMNDIIQTI